MKCNIVLRGIGNIICFIYILIFPILSQLNIITLDFKLYTVSSLLLIIITNFNALKEFSIIGNKIKLTETIKNAEATIDDIKSLAVVLSDSVVHNLTTMNRFGTDQYEKNKKIENIIKYLKKIGIKTENIDEITKIYYVFMNYDFASLIMDIIYRSYKDIFNVDRPSDDSIFPRKKDLYNPLSPDELESVLNAHININKLSRNYLLIKKGIQEYRTFIKNKTIDENGFFKEHSELHLGYYE